jgi:hypothetical protein
VRPKKIVEIAMRAASVPGAFDMATREFLDSWQMLTCAQRTEALAEEPPRLTPLQDAYLAALAEHLALSECLLVPRWTQAQERFLAEPFFAGGLESLKAMLLVESPLAFRKRLIFISADGLSRPSRKLIQDNALTAALDV